MGPNTSKLRIAVLLSGGGRTLQNLIDQMEAGELPIEIPLVISSRDGVKGIDRARSAGLAVQVIPRGGSSETAYSAKLTAAIDTAEVDLVCMAGFLSKWTFPAKYTNRVMNIHPALLPKYGGKGFYGHRVHEAVIAARESESGCTVHFADDRYDTGPIILQRKVPVLPDDTPDTLAERVFDQECTAYPEAIRLFAENRLRVEGGMVTIAS
jgi:formyltetrahydrofolate-dependent phosphoribosylglycinamide formyltransferase